MIFKTSDISVDTEICSKSELMKIQFLIQITSHSDRKQKNQLNRSIVHLVKLPYVNYLPLA